MMTPSPAALASGAHRPDVRRVTLDIELEASPLQAA